MATATDRVLVRRHTRYGGRVLRPGDEVAVPSDIAFRWAARGIATLQVDATQTPKQPQDDAPTGTPLPEDFPERSLLEAYGFTTLEAVKGMSQSDLVALKGIGAAKAKAILEAAGAA